VLAPGHLAMRLRAAVLQRDAVAHLPVHLHERYQHLRGGLQALLAAADAQRLQGNREELHRHGKLRAVRPARKNTRQRDSIIKEISNIDSPISRKKICSSLIFFFSK
jgi:hypothetical protein